MNKILIIIMFSFVVCIQGVDAAFSHIAKEVRMKYIERYVVQKIPPIDESWCEKLKSVDGNPDLGESISRESNELAVITIILSIFKWLSFIFLTVIFSFIVKRVIK